MGRILNSYVVFIASKPPFFFLCRIQNFIWLNVTSCYIIHSLFCVRKPPQTLSKSILQTMSSNDLLLNFQYPLISLMSSSRCLLLLPHLAVTYTPSFILPSITLLIKQSLHNIWPTQLAFILFVLYIYIYIWHSFPPWLYVILLLISHIFNAKRFFISSAWFYFLAFLLCHDAMASVTCRVMNTENSLTVVYCPSDTPWRNYRWRPTAIYIQEG